MEAWGVPSGSVDVIGACPPELSALLSRKRNAVLGTRSAAGTPMLMPLWYLWDGQTLRFSTPSSTAKVRNLRLFPNASACVDDHESGSYVTVRGQCEIIEGALVEEYSIPLLHKYLPVDEAAARWRRINSDGSRVVILLVPEHFEWRSGVG